MDKRLNGKRILIFLAFSFGVPWGAALLVVLSGWFGKDPIKAQGLANTIFISTPWLASIAARLITREGWIDLNLRPNFKRGWRFYLAAWLLPLAAAAVGALLFYSLYPESFDPSLSALQALTAGTSAAGINPWLLFVSAAINIMLISVPINSVASLGEELGWRGYLLPKLADRFQPDPIGIHKAALITGLVHGVWHWPLLFLSMSIMPGVTYLTPLIYLTFTCSLSVLLSWVTLRSGSVWPAALGHGAANAASALPNFLLKGAPVALIGPDPAGVLGGIGYTLLALILLRSRKTFAAGNNSQAGKEQVAGV